MPLLDHLRELRSRLLRGVLAIVAATVLGFVFYEQLLAFLTEPYRGIEPQLADQGIDTNLVITGIGGAFQFQLKIALVAGIVTVVPALAPVGAVFGLGFIAWFVGAALTLRRPATPTA